MFNLNHRQCRQARGLLKWNSQDLSSHTKLSARRIEAFERGLQKLETFEMRELYDAFCAAGLQFSSTQVTFKKKPLTKESRAQPAPTSAPVPVPKQPTPTKP